MRIIEEVDENFKVNPYIGKEDVKFYDPREGNFDFYGLYNPMQENTYIRLPLDVAKNMGKEMESLNYNTSGGRIKFSTDSEYVAIHVEVECIYPTTSMSLASRVGFSLYEDSDDDSVFRHLYRPYIHEFGNIYEGIKEFKSREMRSFTLDFPEYGGIRNIYIGLQKDATISSGKKYRNTKPVLFYGTSITQGGSSRPGNSYPGMLSHRYNLDYINFGFSGNGMAQKEIVEYMAKMEMGAFVCDYEANSPSCEHLKETLPIVYESIRKGNPDIPFIVLSRPTFYFDTPGVLERRNTIRDFVNRVYQSGDKNIYFGDGSLMCGKHDRDVCTTDGIHPNDLGLYRMTEQIGPILAEALGI